MAICTPIHVGLINLVNSKGDGEYSWPGRHKTRWDIYTGQGDGVLKEYQSRHCPARHGYCLPHAGREPESSSVRKSGIWELATEVPHIPQTHGRGQNLPTEKAAVEVLAISLS